MLDILQHKKRKVAGSIPWKQRKVAVGYDEDIWQADTCMAEAVPVYMYLCVAVGLHVDNLRIEQE
jgi:hypothetical protein